MRSTRINISDISQIGGANGYAEEQTVTLKNVDQAIPSSNPNGRTFFLFLFFYEIR